MELDKLEAWFAERPKWQQEAARRLVDGSSLSTDDFKELLSLCLAEVACQDVSCEGVTACSLDLTDSSKPLRLTSISNVNGVNALAPTKPLDFGKSQLCIVYGRNGAGKSGYVRLLKHACGARKPGVLVSNIFEPEEKIPCATISFIDNGEEKTLPWGEALDSLKGVEIYDTACGLIYTLTG